MKHIKLYEELTTSSYIRDGRVEGKVYHVSSERISHLGDTPIWFALEKAHSDQWFENTIDDHGQAYQYEATIVGKVAHITDPHVESLFSGYGIDPGEWEEEIVGNPDSETVMGLEGTGLLISEGYVGIVYSDYDPSDWSKDLDALIVFNPSSSVRGFQLTREV